MSVAVPDVPSTDGGGVAWPKKLSPQQTTNPAGPAAIAQLWLWPAEMAAAVPVAPFTDGGGFDWPKESSPQQTAIPVLA